MEAERRSTKLHDGAIVNYEGLAGKHELLATVRRVDKL